MVLRKLIPLYSTAWRAAIVLLSVEIAIVSILKYFTDLMPPPEPVVANAFANPYLAIHVISGVVALLAGPFQFVARIRESRPAFHRAMGRVYFAASIVAAPSGLVLSVGTTAGPVAGWGFGISAVLVPLLAWLGVRAAIDRRIDDHRDWMLRSYAIIANAITLRLMLPAAGFMGIGFFTAYPIIAWIGWITNLAVAEYVIRRRRLAAQRFETLATA